MRAPAWLRDVRNGRTPWLPAQSRASLGATAAARLNVAGRCCLAVVVLVTVSWAGAVGGQESRPAIPASLRLGGADFERRAELQRELDRRAEVLEAQSAVVKLVAKLVGPAVVHIHTETISETVVSEYGRHARRTEDDGSGVIVEWKDQYYVLTNRHVIHNASPANIRINLADGRAIHPRKVLSDATTDVALLLISAPQLVAVPIGDSDRTEIGDFVLAVGSPFGLNRTVTFGIISARGRRDLRLGNGDVDGIEIKDFLQTDAAINPGNSGGPLVNLRGQVIGINTAIASNSGGNEGIGFAIPINMFMCVGRQLIEHGKITRAFLGVKLDPKFGPAMAAELGLPRLTGAYVTTVTPGSPAELAKLRVGDVVLEFNGIPIEDDIHLVNLVSLTEVGRKVPVVIFRDRKAMTITTEVGERSRFEP